MQCLALVAAGLAGAGLLQAVAGWAAVRRFASRPVATAAVLPPVTVMKPLHGDEPMLEEALASFCAQDYPAFQIVCGVQDEADPAVAVVHRLRGRFPALDIALVVDPTQHGSNRKVGNLVNMFGAVRHDMLVVSDSDIHVAPDYLRRVVATLAQPGAGLATTVYAGLPARRGLAARLGATQINHAFLPGALMARALGRQDCLGATMALTRDTLARVGGFAALANNVADDAVLGQLVRATGKRVALAPTVPATTVPEGELPSLFSHELRWARTIRSMEPLGFALSVVQFPLFWAVLAVLLAGGEAWAWELLAASWAVRAVTAAGIDGTLRLRPTAPAWSLPLRDMLSVAVLVASFQSKRVAWRGHVQVVGRPLRRPQQGLISS